MYKMGPQLLGELREFWNWCSPRVPSQLGTTSHQSQSAKLLSSAKLISVHAQKQVSLKGDEQFGASFERPGWVFHTTPHKSGSKQNEPNDSSFMLSALLGKERLHLGFSGPGLALNWEDATHDLPITPQEHSTSNKNVMKRRGRILAACHAVPQLLHKNTWFRMPVFINPATWVQSIQA